MNVFRTLYIIFQLILLFEINSLIIYYNDDKCIEYYNNTINVKVRIKASINQTPRVCWIFNSNNIYQVLISFGSIIKNNVGQKFIFYFIIPKDNEINLSDFKVLLKYDSEIKVLHYDEKFATLPKFSRRRCSNKGIILVKLFLKDILIDVDKVLYLDTDIIDTSSIIHIWDYNLNGKTMAATHRVHIPSVWINSGVILYNLNDLRKRDSELWKCADMANCVVDDAWHTWCHKEEWIEVLPYRYNVEFLAMSNKYNQSEYQINEEENACLFHLKDSFQKFYEVNNTRDMSDIQLVNENPKISKYLDKLFAIKNWVDDQIENSKPKRS